MIRVSTRAPDADDLKALNPLNDTFALNLLRGSLPVSLAVAGVLYLASRRVWLAAAGAAIVFGASVRSNVSFFRDLRRRKASTSGDAVEVIEVEATRVLDIEPPGDNAPAYVFFSDDGRALVLIGQWLLERRRHGRMISIAHLRSCLPDAVGQTPTGVTLLSRRCGARKRSAPILDLTAVMDSSATFPTGSALAIWILATLAMMWFLREARSVLIPIALAVLISYALEPVVAWLERKGIHRIVGSAVVLVLVLGGIGAGAYALRYDAVEMVQALPKAAQHARELVTTQLGSTTEALGQVSGAMNGEPASARESGESNPTGTSGEVAVSLVQQAAGAIVAFAGHFVVIVFLVLFLLISGHHVRNRLVEIAGAENRQRAAGIIDEINAHIQRYLLVLLFTAAIVAVATWLVLAAMDVENAAMWGVLAGVFNSIPYFGPVVVAGGLFVVGIVQGEGISQAVQMSGATIVITSLEGWLLTPPLMGKAERMSALAVFIGLLLWTWIWGAWGTVLAVPMLVILKSTADHVPRLRTLGRLMAP